MIMTEMMLSLCLVVAVASASVVVNLDVTITYDGETHGYQIQNPSFTQHNRAEKEPPAVFTEDINC